jgi:hypothetical protein
MAKFIVEMSLPGFLFEEDMIRACAEFIKNSLNKDGHSAYVREFEGLNICPNCLDEDHSQHDNSVYKLGCQDNTLEKPCECMVE